MKNMNRYVAATIIAGTALLFVAALTFAIFREVPPYGIFAFVVHRRLQWLGSDWLGYTIASIGVLLMLFIAYFGHPPEHRYRFQKSSLHWRNLWNGFKATAMGVVAIGRNNVLTLALIAWGVIVVGVMAVGIRISIPALEYNGGLLTLATLYLCIWVWMIAREPAILVGAVPAYGIMTLYWIPEVFKQSETPIHFILWPIIPAVLFLFLWIPAQYGLLKWRQKSGCRTRLGPFVETLALISLATPWIAAAYWFPNIFVEKPDQTIGTVVALLMGLVWSQLVAAPFTRFVRSRLR